MHKELSLRAQVVTDGVTITATNIDKVTILYREFPEQRNREANLCVMGRPDLTGGESMSPHACNCSQKNFLYKETFQKIL